MWGLSYQNEEVRYYLLNYTPQKDPNHVDQKTTQNRNYQSGKKYLHNLQYD